MACSVVVTETAISILPSWPRYATTTVSTTLGQKQHTKTSACKNTIRYTSLKVQLCDPVQSLDSLSVFPKSPNHDPGIIVYPHFVPRTLGRRVQSGRSTTRLSPIRWPYSLDLCVDQKFSRKHYEMWWSEGEVPLSAEDVNAPSLADSTRPKILTTGSGHNSESILPTGNDCGLTIVSGCLEISTPRSYTLSSSITLFQPILTSLPSSDPDLVSQDS